MNSKADKYIYQILRLGFGFLLLGSSIHKLIDPFTFSLAVKNYAIIGIDLSRWVAVMLPILEAFVGLLLITGVWLKSAGLITHVLMWFFFLSVIQAWHRHLDISCGCFDNTAGRISTLKLIENGFLVWASYYLIVLLINRRHNWKHSP